MFWIMNTLYKSEDWKIYSGGHIVHFIVALFEDYERITDINVISMGK